MTIEWAFYIMLVATVAAWLFAEWRVPKHRCPPAPLIPIYEPPPGLSPAVARWLTRRGYDTGTLTASMMSLVNAKQIVIRRAGKKEFSMRVPAAAPTLPSAPEERDIVHLLRRFTQGGALEMAVTREHRENIVDLRTRHRDTLREIVEGDLHLPGRWAGYLFRLGLIAPVITVLLALFIEGFGLYAFGAMGLFVLASKSIGPKDAPKLRLPIVALMLPIVAWLGYITVEHLSTHNVAWDSPLAFRALVLPWLTVALIATAGFLLSRYADLSELRPTPEACALRHQAEGLKQFMSRAEMDEIRQHHPDQPLPQTFQRLLPYAAAFGILPLWMNLFAEELARQAMANDGSGGGDGGGGSTGGADDSGAYGMSDDGNSPLDLWEQLESDFDQAISDALDQASSDGSGDSDGGDGGGGD
ncbi:MAG: hypothetical protein AB1479_00600 [Pseudomonadota bacterium]